MRLVSTMVVKLLSFSSLTLAEYGLPSAIQRLMMARISLAELTGPVAIASCTLSNTHPAPPASGQALEGDARAIECTSAARV